VTPIARRTGGRRIKKSWLNLRTFFDRRCLLFSSRQRATMLTVQHKSRWSLGNLRREEGQNFGQTSCNQDSRRIRRRPMAVAAASSASDPPPTTTSRRRQRPQLCQPLYRISLGREREGVYHSSPLRSLPTSLSLSLWYFSSPVAARGDGLSARVRRLRRRACGQECQCGLRLSVDSVGVEVRVVPGVNKERDRDR